MGIFSDQLSLVPLNSSTATAQWYHTSEPSIPTLHVWSYVAVILYSSMVRYNTASTQKYYSWGTIMHKTEIMIALKLYHVQHLRNELGLKEMKERRPVFMYRCERPCAIAIWVVGSCSLYLSNLLPIQRHTRRYLSGETGSPMQGRHATSGDPQDAIIIAWSPGR